jgi:hypothetical protein
MLQGFGIGAGREGKEAAQWASVLPSSGPTPFRTPPQGATARKGQEPRALLTLKVQSQSPRRGIYASKEDCNHTFFSYGSVSSSHARSSAISARTGQSPSRRASLDDLGCSANASAASANFARSAARPTTFSPVLRTSFCCRVTRTSLRFKFFAHLSTFSASLSRASVIKTTGHQLQSQRVP